MLGCGSWGGALGDVLSRKGIPVLFWHRNPITLDLLKKLGNITLLKTYISQKAFRLLMILIML